MDWQRDTVRQVYNHALNEFEQIPEDAGTPRQRVWSVRDTLPEMKDWWPDLNKVYSTVLQKAVERIRDNIENLGKLKDKGYALGSLNWKKPREYRSFTYRQSGFELDKKSGPNGHGRLVLTKLEGETREFWKSHGIWPETTPLDDGLHIEYGGPTPGDLKQAACTECGSNVWRTRSSPFVAEYDTGAICGYCSYECYFTHRHRNNLEEIAGEQSVYIPPA
jgi:hypothetical protein